VILGPRLRSAATAIPALATGVRTMFRSAALKKRIRSFGILGIVAGALFYLHLSVLPNAFRGFIVPQVAASAHSVPEFITGLPGLIPGSSQNWSSGYHPAAPLRSNDLNLIPDLALAWVTFGTTRTPPVAGDPPAPGEIMKVPPGSQFTATICGGALGTSFHFGEEQLVYVINAPRLGKHDFLVRVLAGELNASPTEGYVDERDLIRTGLTGSFGTAPC